ncbi:MAG: phospholipid carrier-dependent glycosyltransferase [Planctomycetia bacterium]|nr:phospholipid carrier-dependent glycosyltransferase [Planctomycetia bacterium]
MTDEMNFSFRPNRSEPNPECVERFPGDFLKTWLGRALLLILFLAFVVRVAGAFYWEVKIAGRDAQHVSDGPFYFADSDSYWKLGRAVAFGRPYQFDEERRWTVFRMPGYPMLLAPFFYIHGEYPPVLSARILNCCLGTCSVALIAMLTWVLFKSQIIALVAAAIAAFDPCLIVESVTVLSEEPFQVALLLQMIILVLILKELPECVGTASRTVRRRRCSQAIALGMLSALTVLFRPSWLYFAPFVMMIVLLATVYRFGLCGRFFYVVRTSLVAIAVFCLCMMPWWLRNAMVTGTFVPTTLQMGASLYDGLSPTATGASDMAFVDSFREQLGPVAGSVSEQGKFERRLDEIMKKAALDWSWNHPREVLRLAGVKFARLWNFIPNEPGFQSWPIRLALIVSYTPVLVLGLWGFVCLCRKRGEIWLLAMPAVYLTLLHIIFVSSLRYRTPAMPMFMILAAWTLVMLWKTHRGQPSHRVNNKGNEIQ